MAVEILEGKKRTHPEESLVGKEKVVNCWCEASTRDVTLHLSMSGGSQNLEPSVPLRGI